MCPLLTYTEGTSKCGRSISYQLAYGLLHCFLFLQRIGVIRALTEDTPTAKCHSLVKYKYCSLCTSDLDCYLI